MKRLCLPLLAMICLAGACSNKVVTQDEEGPQMIQLVGKKSAYMPKATIFRMNGNYANNVAVTLNPDGTLLYYPAPTDISANSAPYPLGGGWYLNRQGVTANSVFTKWSFADYESLEKAPSPQEILQAVIPGSGVSQMETLPITLSEALADPAACKKYLK